MKKGGGRLKGNGFEREVAKAIIDAFKDQGITKEDCFRTPLSGGHAYASKTHPADLQFSDKLKDLFPYAVECKRYFAIEWHGLITGNSKIFNMWWSQTKKAAHKSDQEPLLVFRGNAQKTFAIALATDSSSEAWRQPGMFTRIGGDLVFVQEFSLFLEACNG